VERGNAFPEKSESVETSGFQASARLGQSVADVGRAVSVRTSGDYLAPGLFEQFHYIRGGQGKSQTSPDPGSIYLYSLA
jgi:hypothetical protein